MLTQKTFLDLIKQENQLEILEENKDYCVVACPETGKVSQVKYDDMEKNSEDVWPQIVQTLIGTREPKVLSHVTRIVGYYSSVENWNQSKVGELKDRHEGNYSVQSGS